MIPAERLRFQSIRPLLLSCKNQFDFLLIVGETRSRLSNNLDPYATFIYLFKIKDQGKEYLI